MYYYGRQMLETPGPLQEDKIVNIPSRAGKRDIADALQREGVINVNPWVFIGGVFALKASSDLKPGEYSFQKNASLRDVIATIVEGKVVQHAVTIPEGLTSEQIVARLTDNDIFAGIGAGNAARRHAAAGNLQIPARHHARAGDPAHAADPEAGAGGDLGTPQSGRSGQVAGAADHAGLDHREGNRPGRRAQPRRRGIHQSPAAEESSCSPIRPSSTAWSAARERWAGRSSAARSPSLRPTTPM